MLIYFNFFLILGLFIQFVDIDGFVHEEMIFQVIK